MKTKAKCNLVPNFPVRCVACEVEHSGDLDAAIKDGWHISVYALTSGDQAQFAGCPKHTKVWNKSSVSFLKEIHL